MLGSPFGAVDIDSWDSPNLAGGKAGGKASAFLLERPCQSSSFLTFISGGWKTYYPSGWVGLCGTEVDAMAFLTATTLWFLQLISKAVQSTKSEFGCLGQLYQLDLLVTTL